MESKPSSLAGPLWVVGVGLLILGMGVGFMAWVLWEKSAATNRLAAKPPPTREELEAMIRSNRAAAMPSPRALAGNRAGPASPLLSNSNAAVTLPDGSGPGAAPASAVSSERSADSTGAGGGGPVVSHGSTVFGRVTLRGTPPPEIPIAVTDPNCGKAAPPPTSTRFYVVGKDAGLADVFVYIRRGLEGRSFAVSTNMPVIDQRGCEYTPQVIGLQVGQAMLARNSDKTLHNNHFTPTVPGNQEVNKAHMVGGPDQRYVWSQPEVFLRLKCDVHPWMFAYVGVVEHPFFAVSDADGNFAIAGLPPGRYAIEAVHRKTHVRGGNGIQREIEIKADENLRLDFEVVSPR